MIRKFSSNLEEIFFFFQRLNAKDNSGKRSFLLRERKNFSRNIKKKKKGT